jgi:hypothetical protein
MGSRPLAERAPKGAIHVGQIGEPTGRGDLPKAQVRLLDHAPSMPQARAPNLGGWGVPDILRKTPRQGPPGGREHLQ